jgi:hypothetical protein
MRPYSEVRIPEETGIHLATHYLDVLAVWQVS